jgi:hypothetical protein
MPFFLPHLELQSAQPRRKIERLTYPVRQRLLHLISVNKLEQIAIPRFLGRPMHGSKPFDLTWKEDPYFEKCLLRPHKKITDLPRKHNRKGRSIDPLRAQTCSKGSKLLPGITKILIQSVNQLCFGKGPSLLSFQMQSHGTFYIRGTGLRLPGRRALRRGFGLFRTLSFLATVVSRTQCSSPPTSRFRARSPIPRVQMQYNKRCRPAHNLFSPPGAGCWVPHPLFCKGAVLDFLPFDLKSAHFRPHIKSIFTNPSSPPA